MPTPIVLDFVSRQMANLFDEKNIIDLPTAGQALFGDPRDGSMTVFSPSSLDVDIEIIRGNERLAALVPRGGVGRFLGTLAATQPHQDIQVGIESYFTRTFPLAEEEVNITAHQILFRVPGEGPFEGRARTERFRTLATKGYHEAMRRLIRLDEYLAWQSLLTGKQPSILGNTADVYDFRRNTNLIVTPTYTWSNASGVPLTDIDAMCDKIRAYGKMEADTIILGGSTFQALTQAVQLITSQYGNKLYYNLVELDKNYNADGKYNRLIAGGMKARGTLQTPKGYNLTIFTYIQGYTNTSGTFTKYMTDNSALITAMNARSDRYFGPPERLPMTNHDLQLFMERMGFNPTLPQLPMNVMAGDGVILPETFFVDMYDAGDLKKTTLRAQHAPIFATTMTDCYGVLNTLA
jgi:hypothetical protein